MTASKARLFFALWPDEHTRAGFNEWIRLLGSAIEGRASKSESLHLTVVFLGDVALDRLDALKSVAGKVDARLFELAFEKPACWRHNRIAFAAPRETPLALKNLVAALESGLRDKQFAFDERVYSPHMTLMRRVRWRDLPAFKPVTWRVREFVLVRSYRSEYEVIERWRLAEG